MRSLWRAGVFATPLVMGIVCAAFAQQSTDVPAIHWARKDVDAVMQRGIMTAPGGKFRGETRATRTDLILAMAAFGKSLEKRSWSPATGRKFKNPADETVPASASQTISRYELAAVISRMGSYSAALFARAGEKRVFESPSLPKPADVKSVKKSHPAFAAVQYLGKNRMIWPGSILTKPGSEPVTGKETADATVAVITGIVDMRTDEPQNKPDLGPPPAGAHGKPSRTRDQK